jgi:hypothetical protein
VHGAPDDSIGSDIVVDPATADVHAATNRAACDWHGRRFE